VIRALVLPLLSALLVIASFPPFDFGLIGLVALAPLLLALDGARRPFLIGFGAGWVAFTGIAWWVYYAMAHFGGVPPFAAVPLMLLMSAIMAAFWGLFAWAHARLSRALPGVPEIIIVPILWTASEFLRAKLPDLEFPWAVLGLSLHRHLPLIQIADLGGVWVVSFLVALTGAGVAGFVRDPRGRGWGCGWKPLAAALGVLVICGLYGLFRLGQPPEGRGLRVTVVQGNVPQDVKWDRRFREETFRTHEELTREAAGGGADLVVWSESATAFVYQREPEYQQRLAALVRETGAPLLFGSPAYEMKGGESSLRNRAYLLGPDGQVAGWQDKQQLVPFGEFVPFKRLLFFAKPLVQAVGSFEPGERPEVLAVPGGRFGTLVCYEVIFPDLVRRFAAAGAEFLVNITNDAWYERSAASKQQFANLVFRAVENRRPIARSANTGISGFVDSHGRIVSASELFVKGQYQATLALSNRTTLYTVWGDWLPRMCVLIAMALLIVARFHPGRLPRKEHSP
jgi:apolipoprotein N-acyltransferase